jgi:TonB family protein
MKSLEAWLFTCLLNALWQIPLLFAAAWLAARLARRIGPRTEHRVWVGALFLQSILPFCRIPLGDLAKLARRLAFWNQAADAGSGHVRILLGPGTIAAAPWLHPSPIALAFLFCLYASVLLYAASRLAWGLARTDSLRRHAQPLTLSGDQQTRLDRFRLQFRISRPVEVGESAAITGPLSLGITRPALLLPAGFLHKVAAEDLDAVLAHELAHIRRRDFALNLVCGVVALPTAWHPLLWLTRSRITETREMICDALAANAVQGSENYARSLLRLAAMLPDRAAPGILHAIGIFDANIFERRIMNLMRKHPAVPGLHRVALATACALIALTAGASALALRVNLAAGAPQQTATTKIHVKADDLKILSKVEPVYPPAAKNKKKALDGAVLLDVIIGKDGAPVSVTVSKSLRADYDQSAVDAVKQWRWETYLLNGDPIQVETTITVQYSLKP